MAVPFGSSNTLAALGFEVYSLSENALTIQFGNQLDQALFERIHQFNMLLNEQPFEGFLCSVPAYTSLTVFYDPLVVHASAQLIGINGFERVNHYLGQLGRRHHEHAPIHSREVVIPVCYDEQFGLDLPFLAEHVGLPIDEVIQLHSRALYQVYMIGFVPGFAYLGGLPEALTSPRKTVPRKVVPQGSVGIAGSQTGIYPLDIPGGWQIIGRTPLRLFDPNREHPTLLTAGDQVRFRAIDLQEYLALKDNHENSDH